MRRTKTPAGLTADLMLAPMIIGMRLPLMMMEANAGTGVPGKETMRAVTEKGAAAVNGLVEAQLSLSASMMRFWPDLMAGRVPAAISGAAWEAAMIAAMRPARRTLRSNYKRLGKG